MQNISNSQTYKRILTYCKPYKTRLFVGLLAGILTGGSIFGVLYQLQNFLEPLMGGEKPQVVNEQVLYIKKADTTEKIVVKSAKVQGLNKNYVFTQEGKIAKVQIISSEDKSLQKIPPFMRKILNFLGINLENFKKNPNVLLMIISGCFFLFFMLLKALFTFANQYYMAWVGTKAITDIREELFNKISMQSMKFHEERKVGDMMASIYNETQIIQGSIANTIPGLIRSPIEILAVLIYIIFVIVKYNAYNLIFILILGGGLSILCSKLLAKRVKLLSNKSLGDISFITTRILETLSCIRLVKAYNMEKKEQQIFKKSNDSFFGIMMKITRSTFATSPLMELVSLTVALSLIVYCSFNGLGISTIIGLAVAVNFAYRPVKQLANLNSSIQLPLAAARRVFDVLDSINIISEEKNAIEKKHLEKSISFENISFSYKTEPFIQNLSFTVKKGDYIAFVGEAGSGKSTLVKLINRFYDVNSGNIKIDGVDVRSISLSSLRKLVGFIDQTTILFNEDINYNIAYGLEGATKEKIIEAAQKSHAHKFIIEKPEGYDYNVGEKGEKLSGGQRQRIAIARALLKNPEILVLDEATSALDNITEKAVQEDLNELMEGRTVIAIAHRLSTIKNAHRIYVMSAGSIIEQGTHQQLLEKQGHYYNMWNAQFERKVY